MTKRRVFSLNSKSPYRLSRSQIEEYVQCPRCFYLDRKIGVPKLPSYPFSLNSAVDSLLKNEFDYYRAKKKPHPLMKSFGLDAIPFSHKDLDEWRSNFKGVSYHDTNRNLIICGAVDDLWVGPNGQIMIVDYKSTAKRDEVSLDADWQAGYRRQMEVYQWIMRKMGFDVSNTGYFVYCNGDGYRDKFEDTLHFRTKIIPYIGNDSWVESKIAECYNVLANDAVPNKNDECAVCAHREAVQQALD